MTEPHARILAPRSNHSLPDPPRYDTWPVAVRSALRLRGSLLTLGPGERGTGWPDSPRVRAATLAPWGERGLIACFETAAWVWGSLDFLPIALQFTTPPGHRKIRYAHPAIDVHELRIKPGEFLAFAGRSVTTPLRTSIDLLVQPRDFTRAHRVACRILAQQLPGGATQLAAQLERHYAPGRRRAFARFEQVFAQPSRTVDAIGVVDTFDATNSVQHVVEMGRVRHLEDEPADGQP